MLRALDRDQAADDDWASNLTTVYDYCPDHLASGRTKLGNPCVLKRDDDPIYMRELPHDMNDWTKADSTLHSFRDVPPYRGPTHHSTADTQASPYAVARARTAAGDSDTALAIEVRRVEVLEREAADRERELKRLTAELQRAHDLITETRRTTIAKLSHVWLRAVCRENRAHLRRQLTNLDNEELDKLLVVLDVVKFGDAYNDAAKTKELCWQDAVVLTLVKHRTFVPHVRLGYLFDVDDSLVSIIWGTALPQLRFALENTVARYKSSSESEDARSYWLKGDMDDIDCITDASPTTRASRSSDPFIDDITYGAYKKFHGGKSQFMIDQSFRLLFTSYVYVHSVKDCDIIKASDMLDFYRAGRGIMYDKGTADDEVERLIVADGGRHLCPPFVHNDLLTAAEVELTEAVARPRASIERVIRWIKKNLILKVAVPTSLFPVMSDVLFVCAWLYEFSKSREDLADHSDAHDDEDLSPENIAKHDEAHDNLELERDHGM